MSHTHRRGYNRRLALHKRRGNYNCSECLNRLNRHNKSVRGRVHRCGCVGGCGRLRVSDHDYGHGYGRPRVSDHGCDHGCAHGCDHGCARGCAHGYGRDCVKVRYGCGDGCAKMNLGTNL